MIAPSIGLTAIEARRRLATGGPNAVVDVARHPLRRAVSKPWAPVPWMREAAIILQFGDGAAALAGNIGYADAGCHIVG